MSLSGVRYLGCCLRHQTNKFQLAHRGKHGGFVGFALAQPARSFKTKNPLSGAEIDFTLLPHSSKGFNSNEMWTAPAHQQLVDMVSILKLILLSSNIDINIQKDL